MIVVACTKGTEEQTQQEKQLIISIIILTSFMHLALPLYNTCMPVAGSFFWFSPSSSITA